MSDLTEWKHTLTKPKQTFAQSKDVSVKPKQATTKHKSSVSMVDLFDWIVCMLVVVVGCDCRTRGQIIMDDLHGICPGDPCATRPRDWNQLGEWHT